MSLVSPALPLRRPSGRRRQNEKKPESRSHPSIAWNLDGLQEVQDALQRTHGSFNTWRLQVAAAAELVLSQQQRQLDAIHEEREQLVYSQRALAEESSQRRRQEADVRRYADLERQQQAAERLRTAESERERVETERQLIEDVRRRLAEASEQRAQANLARHQVLVQSQLAERARSELEQLRAERQRRDIEAETQRLIVEAAEEQARADAQLRRARLRDCAACLEQHDLGEVVQLACEHWYCQEALRDAIATAYAARRPFQCCGQSVQTALLQNAIPAQQLEQYTALLEELQEANPVYCSQTDCGTFLPARRATGPDDIQCQRCGTSTCRHCKARSHQGRECPADVGVQQARALASRQGWKACPRCQNMVEKSSGCMHMTCRCSARFCYRCGRLLSECRDRCGNPY